MKRFKEELIESLELDDFAYDYPFYDTLDAEEPNDIDLSDKGLVDTYVSSIGIKGLISVLMGLQSRGVERVYLGTNEDHGSYLIDGVKLTEVPLNKQLEIEYEKEGHK